MSVCKPAPQCQLIMPSGRRCGSVAMRGKPFCYHHSDNHHALAHERILCERLHRLGDKLNALDTSGLLNFLHQKLTTLPNTMTRFPEVSYTLNYTLSRLSEITSLESTIRQLLQQNQQFAASLQATPNKFSNLRATSPESTI